MIIWILIRVQEGVVCGHVLDVVLLHLESVGIGPVLALRIEPAEHFEVDCDVLAAVVRYWDGVQFHVKFHEVVEEVGVADADFGLLFGHRIVEVEGPSLQKLTFLI